VTAFRGRAVTSQNGKGRLFSKERYRSQILPPVAVLEVPTPLAVTHVQPLPGGKVLIASARTPGTDTAEVWDGNGHLEHAGLIGRRHRAPAQHAQRGDLDRVLRRGVFGTMPGAHGVIRFTPSAAKPSPRVP
jgi:hypothetical protein